MCCGKCGGNNNGNFTYVRYASDTSGSDLSRYIKRADNGDSDNVERCFQCIFVSPIELDESSATFPTYFNQWVDICENCGCGCDPFPINMPDYITGNGENAWTYYHTTAPTYYPIPGIANGISINGLRYGDLTYVPNFRDKEGNLISNDTEYCVQFDILEKPSLVGDEVTISFGDGPLATKYVINRDSIIGTTVKMTFLAQTGYLSPASALFWKVTGLGTLGTGSVAMTITNIKMAPANCCEESTSVAPIEITVGEAVELSNSGSLQEGSLYKILGVDFNLYGGTTIWLRAINKYTFEKSGTGMFYNPKYDQSVLGFNVWNIGNTYTIGDISHWGGRSWTNINGLPGASTDMFNLDSEWTVIPYSLSDYNAVYDEIKYDLTNDMIIERIENNNNIVSFSYLSYRSLFDQWGIADSPIKVFMWGNEFVSATGVGLCSHKITDSYCDLINFRGVYSIYITISNNSVQRDNIFDLYTAQEYISIDDLSLQHSLKFSNGGAQSDVSIKFNSNQYNLTFDGTTIGSISINNSSFMNDCIFKDSNIEFVDLDFSSYINNLSVEVGNLRMINMKGFKADFGFPTFDYSSGLTIGFCNFVSTGVLSTIPDLSTASYIASAYPKDISIKPDASISLRFVNSSNLWEFHNIND